MIVIKIIKKLLFNIIVISCVTASYPETIANNGIVTSSNNLASSIGLDILKSGGNAIDAAVAVGFALAVVHPGAGNIGGGGFMVIRLANGEVTTIDFRETAPSKSSRDMFLDQNDNVIKDMSWNTIYSDGVPGTVGGLGYAHEKFGKVKWKKLVNPAKKIAYEGFDLDPFNASYLNSDYYRKYLTRYDTVNQFVNKEELLVIGEKIVQKDLANTLSRISKYGYKEFYNGKTAKYIVETMKNHGGLIDHNDLQSYSPIERAPIHFKYRDYNIYSMPEPSSGGIVLAEILNQLENYNFNSINFFHSYKHIFLTAEAEKQAYSDRAKYLGDPSFHSENIDFLTTQAYADSLWLNINYDKPIDIKDIYNFNINEKEETTHYSIVDKFGNAVSVTTTLNGWFGSGIIVNDAGFLLNNEMDDFSAKPGFPNKYGLIGSEANSIAPKKRMLSSMSPTIVTDIEDDLYLVLGSPGGSTIITTIAQIIQNVIDFEMNIQEAVTKPRFHHQFVPNNIYYEKHSISSDVIKKLEDIGYSTELRRSIGEANCIQFNKSTNTYYGTSDRRRNGKSLGY